MQAKTMEYDVIFPNLGIYIKKLNPVAFKLFNQEIYWYAIIIVTGILLGLLLVLKRAEKRGMDKELFIDFSLYALISSIIGARLYYVIFSWDSFKGDFWSIFNIRGGGMAIYGAVIAGAITLYIYSKHKKQGFFEMADVIMPSLILGQAIGRWGNFMNMEAFGGESKGLFAMALNVNKVKYIPKDMEIIEMLGSQYISVQPTFLYESMWNFASLILLLYIDKNRKFTGETTGFYFILYGLGRFWIEGLRTDQLLIGSMPVSQILSALLALLGLAYVIYNRKKVKI